jgi:hypothetical protein
MLALLFLRRLRRRAPGMSRNAATLRRGATVGTLRAPSAAGILRRPVTTGTLRTTSADGRPVLLTDDWATLTTDAGTLIEVG